jgi:hypothetical protein
MVAGACMEIGQEHGAQEASIGREWPIQGLRTHLRIPVKLITLSCWHWTVELMLIVRYVAGVSYVFSAFVQGF